MNALLTQALLYGLRPTIGKTVAVAATSTSASQLLTQPGLYTLQNMGPDPVFVRMVTDAELEAGAVATVTNSKPLFPPGSGDRSEIEVFVSPDRGNFAEGPNVLLAITGGVGKTASVLCTNVTRK